jgi:hypothetical protein
MSWDKPETDRAGVIQMELREYRELGVDYRLVHTYSFSDNLDAMLHLESNFLYAGGQEWYRTSTEIDEDRETLVFYAVPSEDDISL